MSVKINDGESNKLQITIPAKGETGWSSKVRQAFQDIGDHDHSGGGKGTQLTATSIADDAITPAKLSADVKLSSLADVQDTDQSAANLAGKILTYSNGAFRPLEFNSQNFTDIDTVININTQTELDAATFPRGSVVSVRNTSGTGYASGAADFSSNTLDGITIVADYPVKTSIITNCTIICSDAVELAGLTTNCKVQSNNNLTLSSGNIVNSDLHADTLVSSNSTTIAVQKSKGFFSALNVTNSNLSVADTSVLEAKTITSFSGTPTASAGTGPYQIVGAVVRKQKLPETASTNDILKYNGSEWVADSDISDLITIDSGLDNITSHDNPSASYPTVLTKTGTGSYEFQDHGAHVYYKTWTINIPSRSTSSLQTYSVQISPSQGIGSNGHAQFDNMQYDINNGIVSAGLIRYANNNGLTSTSQNYPIQHIPLIKCTSNVFWNHGAGYTVPSMIDIGLGLSEMPPMKELLQTSTSSFSSTSSDIYSPNLSMIRFSHMERVYLHIATAFLEDSNASATITLRFRIVKFPGDYAAQTSTSTI